MHTKLMEMKSIAFSFLPTKLRKSAVSIYIIATFTMCAHGAHAINRTAVSNSGNGWSVASNWSPSGVPQNGDSVFIPTSFTLKVKGNVYSSGTPNIIIVVRGILDFDPSGKLDLGSGSQINVMQGGSIVSDGTGSEIIQIGGVTKFAGDADGTIVGPAYATSSTGASPGGFNYGVLSTKLEFFSARRNGDRVDLNWRAQSDHAADRFIIQESDDGTRWRDAATLPAATLLNQMADYRYSLPLALDRARYYRLQVQQSDGKIYYSAIVAVGMESGEFRVYPNPAQSMVKVVRPVTGSAGTIRVEIFNMLNAPIFTGSIKPGMPYLEIDTRNFPSGCYRLRISGMGQPGKTELLMITR